MFPCEFCENFKNIFFIEHLRTTASIGINLINDFNVWILDSDIFHCSASPEKVAEIIILNGLYLVKYMSLWLCI